MVEDAEERKVVDAFVAKRLVVDARDEASKVTVALVIVALVA